MHIDRSRKVLRCGKNSRTKLQQFFNWIGACHQRDGAQGGAGST